uniref:Prospero domain-containing protein n=1 Tax=Mola mola TaxID=94237 RepID=A0A3Q3X5K9_MOLML
MYSFSNISFDSCTAEYLSSYQTDLVPSNLVMSGASVTLHKDSGNINILPERVYSSSSDVGLESVRHSQLDLSASRDTAQLSTRKHPSSASDSCGHHGWNLNNGHQPKRARVENIIKGITNSAGMQYTDVMTNHHQKSDGLQQNEKIQELCFCRDRRGFCNNSSETSQMDSCTDSYECESSSSGTNQGWKKVKLMTYLQPKPERIKLMADVLKYELSRAVSRSVDSIFKGTALLQVPPNNDNSLQSSLGKDEMRLSWYGNGKWKVEGVQTEALSLVVQKPRPERGDKFLQQSTSRDHHCPKPPGYDSAAHEEDWLQEKTKCLMSTPGLSEACQLILCISKTCVPLLSRLRRSEGLTTGHLKKAKLLFFYTRYPSSQVLKMCFHDVQFTRCITSQLIKWFSNFREFYYIQMEKFARHALADGLTEVRALAVGRESELFRALNMHYNKASDFQVPDRFLQVAEITLREFYIAISVGRDRNPSWKKGIYKVICKLDSDVPAEFKNNDSG